MFPYLHVHLTMCHITLSIIQASLYLYQRVQWYDAKRVGTVH